MFNLEKGGRVDLTKDTGLTKLRLGLGWDENTSDTGHDFDLDASAFILKDGKLADSNALVYYNNLNYNGIVVHTGDNLTGDGDGDDETIKVDLSKLSDTDVDEISFVVTIYNANSRRQNFGQVNNAYIALYNDETCEKLAQYDLAEDFSTETGVQFGSVYKHNGEWKFKAVGAGYVAGLDAFIEEYKAA